MHYAHTSKCLRKEANFYHLCCFCITSFMSQEKVWFVKVSGVLFGFYNESTPQFTTQIRWHTVKVEVLVAQSFLTLCHPGDCSLPASSVHVILQARILEWVAISFSRGSSWPKGSNLGLPHCRQIFHCLSHQGQHTVRDIIPQRKPWHYLLREKWIPDD